MVRLYGVPFILSVYHTINLPLRLTSKRSLFKDKKQVK